MRFVYGSELGRLRIPYGKITVYKITVPSAHQLVDGVDICRELYAHALSTSLLPDDPFFSMRSTSSYPQVLTYAVMRQAVKAAAIRLGVDPRMFSLHSLRI